MPVTQGGGEQRKKNQRNKSDMSRSKSLGDIVEPLNSERLRPIRQKTRTAVISIIDDGEVCLEFFHHKNGEDRVFEVLRISQNGMKISVYQPNGKSGVPLSLQPPSPPPGGCESTRTYLFSNLPSKYWKKYQYTTRFVHLVRKKTPKVTMYSKHARCMLMENTPHADFEVCFYNGAKVHQSQECTRIIEPGGVSYTLESVGGLEERVIRKEESSSNGGQYFPFTVCRKPPVSRKPPKGGDVQTEAHYSSWARSKVNRRSVSCGDESETTSRSQCGQERRNQQSQLTAKCVSRQGSTVSPSSQVIKSVFVQGVGWASQLSTGEVWVQYNDGSQMVIQSSVTSIKYTDSQGTITSSNRCADCLKSDLMTKESCIELSLQEAAAFYSGWIPMQMLADYLDAGWGMGSNTFELVPGIGLPQHWPHFFDAVHFVSSNEPAKL
ncbi:Serine/threonine-protein kinase plk4 [Desmophyllum pertusum]|uniref:Serine/threonine-protein kinase plk4 n=1 Tax=Desmophyllum pertusum TaxID=174260 RepID=A0A9X0DAP4_9CNID|nr:Serine/threonine-protein kinase plk4 [Desmophyllum pertusum]